MEKKCNHKNPLSRGGTSQEQRLVKTLQKDYVHIDEHAYADLILFAKNFSKHLKYYDRNNQSNGTWETFFSYDVSILISFIADNDVREFDASFEDLLKLVEDEIRNLYSAANVTIGGSLKVAVKNNLPNHFPSFKKLFDFILSLADHIDVQIKRLPDTVGLKAFAQNTIQQQCNTPFENLLGFYKVGIEAKGTAPNYVLINPADENPFPEETILAQKYTQEIIQQGLSYMWLSDDRKWTDIYNGLLADDFLYGFGSNVPAVMDTPLQVEQWLRPILKELKSIYNSLSKSFFKVVSESPKYLEATLSEWPDHTPHMALYLSYLKLFRFAQDHLNGVKERHVDFYFKEILQLQERPAKPDAVFAVIELAKQVDDFLLENETAFKAGKDSDGVELIYKATSDTAINKAKVVELKSIYHTTDNGRIYSAPISNSLDGLGEALISEDGHWKPFGPLSDFVNENGIPTAPPITDKEATELFASINQPTEIGFAIASPNLFLKGGIRTVRLRFPVTKIDPTQDLNNANWLAAYFKILFTGEEGWIEKSPISNPSYSGGTIHIFSELSADDPKVVPYNVAIHGGAFQTSAPIVKVLLKNSTAATHIYKDLRNLKITNAMTEVNVAKLKDFVVQNNAGRLDLSNPILPFGGLAKVGSSLIIGSKEVFQKKLFVNALSKFKVNLEWDGLDDLGEVYNAPADIKVAYGYLKANKWNDDDTAASEKEMIDSNFAKPTAAESIEISSNIGNIGKAITKAFDYADDEMYTPNSKDGFIRLNLKDSCGQKEYQRGYTSALIELSRTAPVFTNIRDDQFKTGSGTSEKVILKDPPYVPSFKGLSLDYSASTDISLSTVSGNFEDRAEQFFHIYPFGVAEQHSKLNIEPADITLLPQFDFAGELLIGIEGLDPLQSVSVLFQLAEGTANPLKKVQEVSWYYLYKNKWQLFEDKNKASINDQTNGLLQSGLLTFFLPKKINLDNSRLDHGMVWLRAAIKNNADAICDIIDIKTQAVRLQFEDQGNAEDVLENPLTAKKIKKLLHPLADVKKIDQPYSSFGGKLKEQSEHFHKRISERLRHKDRAITIWDYEHLVLEEFPEIHRVKCLNHTQLRTDPLDENRKFLNEIAPGHVLLVTIPGLKFKNSLASLTPYTSLNTLSLISDFVKKRTSPHVQLEVANPLFEQIELDFQIAFRENTDYTLYKKILNQDILKFLSPWAYENESAQALEFGGMIYKSVLLDYIEELSYVDFVTEFKLNQIISTTEKIMDVEEVIASTPRSVLVSVPEHIINPVVNECV